MPYEGIVELIKKGLIKRVVRRRDDEAFFRSLEADAESEVAVSTEEPQAEAPATEEAK